MKKWLVSITYTLFGNPKGHWYLIRERDPDGVETPDEGTAIARAVAAFLETHAYLDLQIIRDLRVKVEKKD